MFVNLLIGFLFGIAVSAVAWRINALSHSGVVAAALVGGLVYGLGGLDWAILLLVFFTSSSAFSRLSRHRKISLQGKFSKGSYRDWGQVLANGGLGAFLVCLHALFPGQSWSWIAFAGALATVTADTWATELGVLSPAPPRLILTGRPVEPGTSGGVTPLGTLAAVGGSTTIGLVSTWLQPSLGGSGLIAVVAFCGLLGSFVDSLLGATVQGLYTCPTCQKETERFPRHSCGTPTAHTRGWRWLNNDWVNFIASLTGALSAVAASYAVGR